MSIYKLHEITEIGDSANLDLDNPKSANFSEYSKNNQGTFVIDKNIDLTKSRRIVNLNVAKLNQTKFDQVIDINFQEFTDNVNDPTKFLQNKLQSIEQARAKLLAESSNDKDLIRKLQEEIENLRNQLALLTTANVTNKVPDTLKAREVLYADRQGRINDPGYPKIQNKLLSKGRKAVGIIQEDGAFVIYTGNFDEFGNEIRKTKIDQFGNTVQEPSEIIPVAAIGGSNNNGKTSGLKFQISNKRGNLIIFRLNDKTYWQALPDKEALLSYAAKIVLDDDGILTLYDGSAEKWSTKNLDPPTGTTTRPTTGNRVTDTLNAGSILYSDRTGLPGAPTAPAIQNKLLSKNRKAVAIIQPDGNFAVYIGNFDESGNTIPAGSEVTVFSAFGYNTDNKSPAAVKVYVENGKNGRLEVFRISPSQGTPPRTYQSDIVQLTDAARLILTDDGILTLHSEVPDPKVDTARWSTATNKTPRSNPLQPGQKVKLP